MSRQFIHVTYIRTTPEKLWEALIRPEFTRRYWVEGWQDCDWKVGSPWKMLGPDGEVKDAGEVLEYDPPRRLALSWRNEFIPEAKAEGFSRCIYELEPVGDAVKLTLTHEFQTENSRLYQGVSGGWPLILASLKSLLETGDALEATKRWPENV